MNSIRIKKYILISLFAYALTIPVQVAALKSLSPQTKQVVRIGGYIVAGVIVWWLLSKIKIPWIMPTSTPSPSKKSPTQVTRKSQVINSASASTNQKNKLPVTDMSSVATSMPAAPVESVQNNIEKPGVRAESIAQQVTANSSVTTSTASLPLPISQPTIDTNQVVSNVGLVVPQSPKKSSMVKQPDVEQVTAAPLKPQPKRELPETDEQRIDRQRRFEKALAEMKKLDCVPEKREEAAKRKQKAAVEGTGTAEISVDAFRAFISDVNRQIIMPNNGITDPKDKIKYCIDMIRDFKFTSPAKKQIGVQVSIVHDLPNVLKGCVVYSIETIMSEYIIRVHLIIAEQADQLRVAATGLGQVLKEFALSHPAIQEVELTCDYQDTQMLTREKNLILSRLFKIRKEDTNPVTKNNAVRYKKKVKFD